MKSMYEWVELMTKERLDLERAELYVSRCNTPLCNTRLSSASPAHSRPLSALTEGKILTADNLLMITSFRTQLQPQSEFVVAPRRGSVLHPVQASVPQCLSPSQFIHHHQTGAGRHTDQSPQTF